MKQLSLSNAPLAGVSNPNILYMEYLDTLSASELSTLTKEQFLDHFPVNAVTIQRWLKNGKFIIGEGCLEKKCSGCGEYWPLTKEFFHKCSENKATGTLSRCKCCVLEKKYDSVSSNTH